MSFIERQGKQKHLLSVTIDQDLGCITCTYFTSFQASNRPMCKSLSRSKTCLWLQHKCLNQVLNTILLGFSITFHYPHRFSNNSSMLSPNGNWELLCGADRPTVQEFICNGRKPNFQTVRFLRKSLGTLFPVKDQKKHDTYSPFWSRLNVIFAKGKRSRIVDIAKTKPTLHY